MSCGIYMIQNRINGKIYIGQSVNIEERWYNEKRCKHNTINSRFRDDFNTFGADSFVFTIIELCDIEELNNREKFYIKLYHSNDFDFGYNISIGGSYKKNVARNDWERQMLRIQTKKRYYERHKDEIDKKRKDFQINHREEYLNYFKKHNAKRKNTEAFKEARKRGAIKKQEQRHRLCIDPIIGDTITFSALQGRQQRHKEKYKNFNIHECFIYKEQK